MTFCLCIFLWWMGCICLISFAVGFEMFWFCQITCNQCISFKPQTTGIGSLFACGVFGSGHLS